jgi:hypothetical protein
MVCILALGAVAVSVCSRPSPEPTLTAPTVVVTPPVHEIAVLPGVPSDEAIDSYQPSSESVSAEHRKTDLARVLFFIDCLEQATGRKLSSNDLKTAEAAQCRAATTDATAEPGFLERVEALQEAP